VTAWTKVRRLLGGIRKPEPQPAAKTAVHALLLFAAGVLLGAVSKWLDETPSNLLPAFLERLDLRNFFSDMGIWLFLALLISVCSKSPLRAALHVLLFLVGMLASYYAYTIWIAGFFPKRYMTRWFILAALSPIPAAVCWYARGRGFAALFVSAVILMVMAGHAFHFGFWYFSVRGPLEVLLAVRGRDRRLVSLSPADHHRNGRRPAAVFRHGRFLSFPLNKRTTRRKTKRAAQRGNPGVLLFLLRGRRRITKRALRLFAIGTSGNSAPAAASVRRGCRARRFRPGAARESGPRRGSSTAGARSRRWCAPG